MRETKKASEVRVGDRVVPPLARRPEPVLQFVRVTPHSQLAPYVTIQTPERSWTIGVDEPVMVDIPDEEMAVRELTQEAEVLGLYDDEASE